MPQAETCPHCQASLQGEPIPEESRQRGWYGDNTHFSQAIAIYDRALDRTVAFACPFCKGQWAR